MNPPRLLTFQQHERGWSFLIAREETTLDAISVMCEKLGLSQYETTQLVQPFARDAYPYATVHSESLTTHLFLEDRWAVLVVEGGPPRVVAIVQQVCKQHERKETVTLDFDQLRKNLIEIYARYLENPDDEEVCSEAYSLGRDLLHIGPVLPENLRDAVNSLITIGASLDNRPTPEEAKEILTRLQEHKDSE